MVVERYREGEAYLTLSEKSPLAIGMPPFRTTQGLSCLARSQAILSRCLCTTALLIRRLEGFVCLHETRRLL